MLTPGTLTNGNALTYAFGLDRVKVHGRDAIEHDGGSFGYSADFLRFPAERLGVICLCNGTVGAAGLTHKVAELYLPAVETKTAAAETPAPEPVDVPAAELQKLTGLYWAEENDFYRRIELTDGALLYRRTPANATRLIPLTPTRFAMDLPAPRPEIAFEGDTMTFRSGSDVAVFRRVAPYAPTADDLRRIAGRYASEELGREAELKFDKEALTLMLGEDELALGAAGSPPNFGRIVHCGPGAC
jgi:hypothetical protein